VGRHLPSASRLPTTSTSVCRRVFSEVAIDLDAPRYPRCSRIDTGTYRELLCPATGVPNSMTVTTIRHGQYGGSLPGAQEQPGRGRRACHYHYRHRTASQSDPGACCPGSRSFESVCGARQQMTSHRFRPGLSRCLPLPPDRIRMSIFSSTGGW
jgi:hypothetical protein